MGNKLETPDRQIDFSRRQLATPLDFEVTCFDYQWENLVIEGGGSKVIAAVGALKVLDTVGALKKFKRFAGSSAGSIVALCLSLGYSVDELTKLLLETKFADFTNTDSYIGDAARLMMAYGCNDANEIVKLVKRILQQKDLNYDTTFFELYDNRQNELVVTGCNLNTGKTEYFSYKTTPNMEISTAIRISTCVPFVFVPVRANLDNDLYVDGGLLHNFPIEIFDSDADTPNTKTLGIKFAERYETERKQINNVVSFGASIIGALMKELEAQRTQRTMGANERRTISVYTGSVSGTNFAVSTSMKRLLYDSGIKSATNFLQNWVKTNKRRGSGLGLFKKRRKSQGDIANAETLHSLVTKAHHSNREPSGVFSAPTPKTVAYARTMDDIPEHKTSESF